LEANQVEIIQRTRAARKDRINEEAEKVEVKIDLLIANVPSIFFE
jgi:hypothetical protein